MVRGAHHNSLLTDDACGSHQPSFPAPRYRREFTGLRDRRARRCGLIVAVQPFRALRHRSINSQAIRIEHDAVPDAVNAALATNESRRKAVVLALTEDRDLRADDPALVSVAHEVNALADQIEARVNTPLLARPTKHANS